jgi:hypothetical protein
VSCNAISTPELDKTIPVKPPNVNKKINPLANNIGVFNTIEPPNIVAIQLKILIPVGTAIIIVALVK